MTADPDHLLEPHSPCEDTDPFLWKFFSIFIPTVIAIGLLLFHQIDILDKEYSSLIEHGKIVHGEIVRADSYLFFFGSGKSNWYLWPHTGVSAKIICKELNNQVIYEQWSYKLKDTYKAGDDIQLYFFEKNFWVKLASANHRGVANIVMVKRTLEQSKLLPKQAGFWDASPKKE